MTSPNEPRQRQRKRRQELVAPGVPRRTFSVRALASASAGSTTRLRTQGDTMAAPAYIPLRARPCHCEPPKEPNGWIGAIFTYTGVPGQV
jgi:hypothetical protein